MFEGQGQSPLASPRRGCTREGRDNLDSSSFRQPEEMAIFQLEPLQPSVQPGKVEVDRQKTMDVYLVLIRAFPVPPEVFDLGFLKYQHLTSQAVQGEMKGLLGSAEGCLNAAVLCMATVHGPLPSSNANIAQAHHVGYIS